MGMDQPPPPSPPPGGGSQPPDWNAMTGKLKAARGPDRVMLVAGFLFLIATFLPWYRVQVSGLARVATVSASGNAWNVGGLAVIAALFGVATLVLAVAATAGAVKPNPSLGLLALVLAGGTLLFTVLRLVLKPGGDAVASIQLLSRVTVKITRGFGLWFAVALAIVMAVAAFQKYQAESGSA
jgi:hypothetical protein